VKNFLEITSSGVNFSIQYSWRSYQSVFSFLYYQVSLFRLITIFMDYRYRIYHWMSLGKNSNLLRLEFLFGFLALFFCSTKC
jgi:hypothetical protein